MKPSFLLGIVAACLAFTSVVHAGRYGSETRVDIDGSFRTANPDAATSLPKGAVKVTRSYDEQDISNGTILSVMKKRGLITSTTGFSIMMVAQGRPADGIKFFAVRTGVDPVEIPSDLLSLGVADGPGRGVSQENSSGRVTKLNMETVNLASLRLKNFEGTGVFEQTWSLETVTKNDVTESIQLVQATGFFSGAVSGSEEGVGLIEVRLSNPKAVGLKRYGMVTTATSATGSAGATLTLSGGAIAVNTSGLIKEGSSSTVIGGTLTTGSSFTSTDDSGTISITPIPDISSNTLADDNSGVLTWSGGLLDLTGGTSVNFDLTNPNFSNITLLFDTSSIGLGLAFNGAPFSLSNVTQVNELSVNTADGPVVYTRESGNVWTVVEPASAEPTPAEPALTDAEPVE